MQRQLEKQNAEEEYQALVKAQADERANTVAAMEKRR